MFNKENLQLLDSKEGVETKSLLLFVAFFILPSSRFFAGTQIMSSKYKIFPPDGTTNAT